MDRIKVKRDRARVQAALAAALQQSLLPASRLALSFSLIHFAARNNARTHIRRLHSSLCTLQINFCKI
jgi:hypothetical protein